MGLDLGTLSGKVNFDTGQAEANIAKVKTGLEDAGRAADTLTRKKVDVAPSGERELSNAQRAADGLAGSLDDAGKKRVDVTPRGKRQLDDASGSASRLATELDSAASEAQELGAAGDGLGGFEASLSGLASTARNLVPALGAAAAGSAVFTKGWDRLTSIDNATFKLQGLGNSAEATADIMDSAMQSVTGTAYGFGDAASLAASMVASGIQPGEELTRVLTTVADTAAISGRSLGDMGLIFGQVAASGTIMGDDLNQLMDSGIPVLQLLADQLGVTAAEVKEMASDGEVSFAQFEAAMREGMGGAAVEMGQSVSGALSNVGAAAGRLGAEVLSGPFSSLPEVLGSATSGIDSLTEGVQSAYEWFNKIPEPIKLVGGALIAAKAGTAALNTEMGQKLVGTFKGAGDGAKGLGSSVVGAFRDMGDAYRTSAAPLRDVATGHRIAAGAARDNAMHSRDAFTSIDHMGRSTAHSFGAVTADMAARAKGLGGAMRSGIGSVVNMLGGPLNIALAGAGLAFAGYMQASSAAKAADEALAAATDDLADSQSDLFDAVKGTTGALDEQGLAAAARLAKNELAELTEIGGADRGWWGNIVDATTAVDDFLASTVFAHDESAQALVDHNKHVADLSDQYSTLEDAAALVGMPMENLNEVVAEGGPQYRALIAALRGMGEEGAIVADRLEGTRDEIENITDAARDVSPRAVEMAEAVELIADSAGDAETKLDGMTRALQAMGLLPKDAAEDMMEFAETIDDIRESAEGLFDAEVGALGDGLLKANGALDEMNPNARALHDELSRLGEDFVQVASSAESVEEINDAFEKSQGALQALADSTGLPIEKIQELAREFGLVPEELSTLYRLEGTDGAMEQLGSLWGTLYDMPEGHTTTVEALTGGAEAALEEFGYEVEKLANGNYEITVGADADHAGLQEFVDQASALDGILYSMGATPHQIQVHADDLTHETRAMLAEMGAEVSGENLQGQVYVTFPEGSAILENLDSIGMKLVDLNGTLMIDTADVEGAHARLDELGIAAEIQSHIEVDDSEVDNLTEKLDGIDVNYDVIDGKIVIDDADTDRALGAIEELQLDAEIMRGVLTIDSNDEEVRGRLVELGWMVADPKTGELVFNHNIPEVEALVNALRGNVEEGAVGDAEWTDNTGTVHENVNSARQNVEAGAKGNAVMTDNAADVARNIDDKLEGKRTHGRHIITEERRITYWQSVRPGMSAADAARQQGPTPFVPNADGNVVEFYNSGGVRENHVAQIAPAGAWRVWAEEETGGEAYIPLALSKRNRSEVILREVADRFGMTVIPDDVLQFEDGGVYPDRSGAVKSTLGGMHGGAYVMGGFSPSATDCSGAVSAVVNTYLGRDPFESRMSTVTQGQWLAERGFKPGRGDGDDLVVGWYDYGGGANGHTALQLPDGTYVESGGNTGGGFHIGGPAGPLDGRGFTNFMHLPVDTGIPQEDGPTGDLGVESDYGASYDPGPELYRPEAYQSTFTAMETKDGLSGVGSTLGGSFSAPGLASNTPGGGSIGQSLGGHAGTVQSLADQAGMGGVARAVMGSANPFVGNRSWSEMLGPATTDQITSLARQLEDMIGQQGIESQVTSALEGMTPNWDVFLHVSPETIEAFNALGQAEDDRKRATHDVAEAEKALASAREVLAHAEEQGTELSTANQRKLEDAENALAEAREAAEEAANKSYDSEEKRADAVEKANDKVADAEEKLSRVREDIGEAEAKDAEQRAKDIAKATEQVEDAEKALERARQDQVRAAHELTRAQKAYDTAMMLAPFQAVTGAFQHLSELMLSTAESVGRMNDVMAQRRAAEQEALGLELSSIQATHSANQAEREHAALQRQHARQEWDDARAVEDAEWSAMITRRHAQKVLGEGEIILGEVRAQGISDLVDTADAGALLQREAAFSVLEAESQVSLAEAEMMKNRFDRNVELSKSTATVDYAQSMAEIAARELAIATERLAMTQGSASGNMTGIEQEMEGQSKRIGGFFGMLMGLAEAGIGVATGNYGMLFTGGLKAVGGLSQNLEGKAQQQAWEDIAREEYDKLDPELQRAVDLARSGAPASAVTGAVVAASGGSRDDVANSMDLVMSLAKIPLDSMVAQEYHRMAAAEHRLQQREDELEKDRTEAEREHAERIEKIDADTEEERRLLEGILDQAQRQYQLDQTSSNRIRDLQGLLEPVPDSIDRLADDPTTVYYALGGATWASEELTNRHLDPDSGFGGAGAGGLAAYGSSWQLENDIARVAAGTKALLDSTLDPVWSVAPAGDEVVVPVVNEQRETNRLTEQVLAELRKMNNGRGSTVNGVVYNGPVTNQQVNPNDVASRVSRAMAKAGR